jgi:hypothetical protein
MRKDNMRYGWTALRVSALALGLAAFAGTGFAQTNMDKKPTAASHETDDGMAKDAEGGGLKNNDQKGMKMTTGSGAMGQKVNKKSSSKSSVKDDVPTAASHEKDDGMAKDAEGGGLKRNR